MKCSATAMSRVGTAPLPFGASLLSVTRATINSRSTIAARTAVQFHSSSQKAAYTKTARAPTCTGRRVTRTPRSRHFSSTTAATGAISAMFDNNYNPEKDIPDLTGKVAVLTGGSQGIGLGIAAHLLSHNPAKLVVLSQSEQHFNEAKDFLKDFGDVSRVQWEQTSLADLASTNATAKKLKAELPQIDMLILNAGIGVGKYEESKDGIDTHFHINVLSHYILANTLIGNLTSTAASKGDARLVYMSSSLHKVTPDNLKFASLEEINQDVGPTKLYGRTKLADLLLAKDTLRRYSLFDSNLFINATHPGGVSTGQQTQMEDEDAYNKLGTIMVGALRPIFKDPITKGCRSALFASTSTKVKKQRIQGEYIVPDNKTEEPSKQAQDKDLGNSLWELCGNILKTKGVATDFS